MTNAFARARAFVHMDLLKRDGYSDEVVLTASTPEWIVDSGATKHMTPLRDGLHNLWSMKGNIFIGDKSSVLVHGIGNVNTILNGKGGMFTSTVLYVPNLGYHLLLVKGVVEDWSYHRGL